MTRLAALWNRMPDALRQATLYGASLGWTKALAMLTLPLLTAMLVPADFARLELLSSAAEVAALFAGAGLVDTMYRFAGSKDAAGMRAAAEILGLALTLSLCGIALALWFAPGAAGLMPLSTRPRDMALLGIAVALEPLLAMPMAWMRMQSQAATYAVTTMLRSTLQSGLVVACVLAGWGISGVLAGGAIAAVAAALVLTTRQARETGLAVPRGCGKLLAYGFPLVGSGLASFMLGTADRWVLAGAVPAAMLGQYGLAAKMAMIAALLTQPFELWWYPRRIALLREPGGLQRSARTVQAGALLVILAAACTAVGGPLLILLLTPAAYHPAIQYVPWLAVAIALQSLGSLVNVGCYAQRTGLLPMAVNGAAGFVAVAGYLLLIPSHGVFGAIIATLAAQGVRFGLFLWASQRVVRLPLRLPLLLPAAAGACMAGAMPQLFGASIAGIAGSVVLLLMACLAALLTGAVKLPAFGRAVMAPSGAGSFHATP